MTTLSVPPLAATPGLLTAAEFAARYESRRVELVKGVLKEGPMPTLQHGKICSRIDRLIGAFVEERDLGHVMSNDSWILVARNPDTVRGADLCYFSYERLAKGRIPPGLIEAVPDLVVEVRSPSDRWTEVFAKVLEYLQAGVRVVVILDQGTGTASVYRPDELQQIFHNGDPLTLPDVLPGFSVPVSRLFE